ncbi:MAG TPA: glycosyltransferase [Solirubrobacteraceae bacterium]|nr:glycosyltransferase [Solirubrobacteraceae bacterium]
MRIALVSPYSWTYPGGVTRHIEALAGELAKAGHEARVLAPYDPDDALSRRLHRGASPQPLQLPDYLVPLGRTIGLPANGAVSNLAATPDTLLKLRAELRSGGYDVVHIHEPVVPLVSWDAVCCVQNMPLVGTFHTYSENALTHGAAVMLGARRRINRLHARIAVSEAAAWTAKRFFGGHYRIVPNGVELRDAAGGLDAGADLDPPVSQLSGPGLTEPGLAVDARSERAPQDPALRILFVGQAVERKGLPVLLRAFEALREHVPATLTLVGASAQEIAPLLLDDRGVRALGKVSEPDKLTELRRADVLCAPSLHGESFGMVLTEAFAAGTPVVASAIPGYRDVVRNGVDGLLVERGDALALAEALRSLALDPERRARMAGAARERAKDFAWPHVAAAVVDSYEQAITVERPSTQLARTAVRHGLAPADGRPRSPARRLPSLQPPRELGSSRRVLQAARRTSLVAVSLAGLLLALLALERVGVDRVVASLLASSPGLVAAGLGLMCVSMTVRALAWHAILSAAPTWRKAKRRDALQGTCIGVLMSATLPARLGEPSRALIVARRLGRARETLPVVLGTMISQTLLNLLALGILGVVMFSSVDLFNGHHHALIAATLAPLTVLLIVLVAPVLVPASAISRSARLQGLLLELRHALVRVRDGLLVFRQPRQAAIATTAQLGAWVLQWMACWLLLMALGLDGRAGIGAAAAVLFAVNVTAVIPATPANVGVFQAACVAVLAGAYHVSSPDALAYGIILQVVEVATAVVMGMPALLKEGLSWKDVRLRAMHAAPVKLSPLPASGHSRQAHSQVRS